MNPRITWALAGLREDLAMATSVEEIGPIYRAARERLTRLVGAEEAEAILQRERERYPRCVTESKSTKGADGVRADKTKLKRYISYKTGEKPDLRDLGKLVKLPADTIQAVIHEEDVTQEVLEKVAAALDTTVDKIKKKYAAESSRNDQLKKGIFCSNKG